ncbi:hypothetical protein QEH52_15820 [Coraliomargarita sp. SDUM461003]|uniref:Uncharacterized protein n=2 Tax=Thalassobacterium maritimum TaxID=3041265 RepID=A0ABU1AXV5_9BACT|nr:hypothetical protein [Coraliomargarita sp. SDUM461003]
MQASLLHMNMPEIANAVGEGGYGYTKKIDYLPALAFWGIYSDSRFQLENTGQIEKQIFDLLQTYVDLPIHLVSPSSQEWEDRQSMIAAQYNLLALFSIDEDTGDLRLRFHLIERLDVSQGNSLDLLTSNTPEAWTVQHRAWTLELPKTQFSEGLQTPEVVEELKGLLFGEWQNADAPFRIDEETAHLPDFADLDTIWEIFSKASISGKPKSEWFRQKKIMKPLGYGALYTCAYEEGFLRWILTHSDTNDPDRPWLLAFDLRNEHHEAQPRAFSPEEVKKELLQNYPNHLATKILRFNDIIRILSPENIDAHLPELQQMLNEFSAHNEQHLGRLYGAMGIRNLKEILNHLSDPSHPINFSHSIKRLSLDEIKVSIHRVNNELYFTRQARENAQELLTSPSEIPNERQWAKEAQLMLQLNPYLAGHYTHLKPKLIALLKDNPDSAFLNSALKSLIHAYRRNKHIQDLDFDYLGHWTALLATGKHAEALGSFFHQLPISQAQRQLLCEAMAIRILSSTSEEILADTFWLLQIMNLNRIRLGNISDEGRSRWQDAFRNATPYTKIKQTQTYFMFMKSCYLSGETDYVRDCMLNIIDECLAHIEKEKSPERFLRTSSELAALLIATGAHEAAGQVIHVALGKALDLQFEKGSRERLYWMHLRIAHAEQLFLSNASEEAMVEIESFLVDLDGAHMEYYGPDRSYKKSIGKHALNLKRKILEATHD